MIPTSFTMTPIRDHFQESAQLAQTILGDDAFMEAMDRAGQTFIESLAGGHKILACGNGGSMCDAMHFAEELSGRYREDRKPLAAVALSDPSVLTCIANDYGFDQVFSRQVQAIGKPGDALLAISTSGNSENVLQASEASRELGMKVIALTGNGGGRLASVADVHVCVPWTCYADRIQEVHIRCIHSLIDAIETAVA